MSKSEIKKDGGKIPSYWRIHWLFAILVFFIFSLLCCGQANASEQFAETCQEEAVSEADLPDIIDSHPRLLIRKEQWKRGPCVIDLRQWANQEPLKSYLKRRPWNPKPGVEWAFRYLITGDEKLAPPIVERMKEKKGYWAGYLTTLAILYDWLYNSPAFSDEDKEIVEDKMVAWASSAIAYGEKYHDIWSHFGYRPVSDIAAAGLALYGHRPEAQQYLAIAKGYIEKNMFPGWAINGGAWQGGWAYYGQGAASLFEFIAMWSSATTEDLYEIIEDEQGGWLRKHLYFLISTTYPDGKPFDTTGFNYAPYRKGALSTILTLTRALNDPEGLRVLKKLDKVPWWAGIKQFMYYTPQMRKEDIEQKNTLLTQIWGRNGIGYVQMRSGWEEDDTIIDFKCGDYFWSHQFQNQNSFTIYKNGKLAVQSGVYDAYWGDHMQFYYRPTIGSNSILVLQPGEVRWIPPNVAKRYGIPNKDGYIKEWGGQRSCYMIPRYGSAETCFTFDKYLYRKNHQHHFETGDIKAFEATDRYSYVYGDATMAYNNPVFSYPGNKPKIDLFTREMVFLDKKYLVVFDRVNSLDAGYDKRWLLHSIGEPEFDKKPVIVRQSEHLETYNAGLVRIDNKDGTLYCQTLFPENYLVRKVGGSATVTRVKTDPANKGNSVLMAEIKGKYRRVSSSIATDVAQREDWVIEFIDSDRFRVKGSISGEDGAGSRKGGTNSVFISNSSSLFIPAKNWQGNPQKGDKFYFSVLNPSCRFRANGKNHAPSVKKLYHIFKDNSHIDPGNWRIEVFPKKKQKFDTFLHLLYPCDRDTAAPPVAEGITTTNNNMKGINIDNWIVLFGYKGKVEQSTQYSIKSKGKISNLLLDMKPGSPYLINIKGSSKTDKQKIIASKEGTLFFTTAGKCRVEIIQ